MTARFRNAPGSMLRRAHRIATGAPDTVMRALGVAQPEDRIIAEAADYWGDDSDPTWRDNSHWCDGDVVDRARFGAIGAEHLATFDSLAASLGGRAQLGTVVEWGAGGGANAVAFAPRAEHYVAVDVAPSSPPECRRQVEAICATPVTEVVTTVADPEAGLAALPGPADLFLCLYVLELVPTPEYGMRLMALAREALRPGGLAFVQIKYDDGTLAGRARRRDYRRHCANMTTYRIQDFWTGVRDLVLVPRTMTLVPENALDQNYAYLLLQRAETG